MTGDLGRVEVLLATRNSARYLGDMLDSLARQTFDDFHLVVSDDASRDETVAMVQARAGAFRHAPRIVRHEAPSGSAMANFAHLLELSAGDYVMLADHDDVWFPDRVEAGLRLVRGAEARYGREVPILAHTDLRGIGAHGDTLFESYWSFKQIRPEAGARLPSALMHATVTGCAASLNRALVERALPIPKNAIMHDWWLNLVAVAFGETVWDQEPHVSYRVHGSNVSRPRRVGIWAALSQLDRVRASRGNIRRRFAQGRSLYERFGDQLPASAHDTMKSFVDLQGVPAPARQLAMVKGGFLWPGVWRNLVQLPFA